MLTTTYNLTDEGPTTIDGFVAPTQTAELSNGAHVTVSQLPSGIRVTVSQGANVSTTDFGTSSSSTPVVTATADGFVVAYVQNYGGTDNDVIVRAFDNAGAFLGSSAVDSSLANDSEPSIVHLSGHQYVVAWTRTTGTGTDAWYGIYDTATGVVRAPQAFEIFGGQTISENVALAKTAAGFVMVYEIENPVHPGGRDIVVQDFDSFGNPIASHYLGNTNTSADRTDPVVTVLENGFLVIGYTENSGANILRAAVVVLDGTAQRNVVESSDYFAGSTAAGGGVLGVETIPGESAGSFGFYYANGNVLTFVDVTLSRQVVGDGADDNFVSPDNLNTVINGGSGNDTLNGGLGVDQMTGGLGNDTYYVDNAGDLVTEKAGQGTDRVFSTVTFNGSLANAVGIENITLTGSAAINAAGNALNNTITGNSANNGLNGGKGADTLIGGLGNDTYTIDSTGDVITELAGQGTDTVKSAISFTLSDTLENLTLVSTRAINGIGNAGVNVIIGGEGANIIAGKGGADMLTGGAGSDTFDYNATTESSYSAYDRITDLTNSDKIDLSGIDANTSLAGNQAFSLVNAFSNHAGEVLLKYDAAKDFTVLSADVNGDGVADMRIVINGDHHTFTNFAF